MHADMCGSVSRWNDSFADGISLIRRGMRLHQSNLWTIFLRVCAIVRCKIRMPDVSHAVSQCDHCSGQALGSIVDVGESPDTIMPLKSVCGVKHQDAQDSSQSAQLDLGSH